MLLRMRFRIAFQNIETEFHISKLALPRAAKPRTLSKLDKVRKAGEGDEPASH
jgi:hypothetical protein